MWWNIIRVDQKFEQRTKLIRRPSNHPKPSKAHKCPRVVILYPISSHLIHTFDLDEVIQVRLSPKFGSCLGFQGIICAMYAILSHTVSYIPIWYPMMTWWLMPHVGEIPWEITHWFPPLVRGLFQVGLDWTTPMKRWWPSPAALQAALTSCACPCRPRMAQGSCRWSTWYPLVN